MKTIKKGLLAVRVLLCILILVNLALIFSFSLQNAPKSSATSGQVSNVIADLVVEDFESKTEPEKAQIVKRIDPSVRQLAHMTEFGTLGAWILLLLLTLPLRTWLSYLLSLAATLALACTDELLQMLSDGRAAQFTDILTDLGGALILCTLILAAVPLVRAIKRKKEAHAVQITRYSIVSPNAPKSIKIAVAADLHNNKFDRAIEALRAQSPDLILIPGDLMDDEELREPTSRGYEFLRLCVALAPTFYSVGNHEIACYHKGNPWRKPTPRPIDGESRQRIAQTGAVLLDQHCAEWNGFTLCGLTSGINKEKNEPDAAVLSRFAAMEGYRILLCHHPEYFRPYVSATDIDLTVSGHAHGGQWRVFGQGIYSPGQGLFPRDTAGVIDQRCVISRGIGTHTWIPRIFNAPELVIIDLKQG